jgi:5-methylcytosine-specific restriction enzyme A
MARSEHKLREQEERRRLELLEKEEQRLNAPPDHCVFCKRLDLHDMSESSRIKGKWEKKFEGSSMCLQCHTQLHRLHKNRELARDLDTIEAVLADESFSKYLKWAVKLPAETVY